MRVQEIMATARHSHACDGGYSVVGGAAADAAINALHASGHVILPADEVEALTNAGGRLANCAFNLEQSSALPTRDRVSLKLSQEAWDAAIRALKGEKP